MTNRTHYSIGNFCNKTTFTFLFLFFFAEYHRVLAAPTAHFCSSILLPEPAVAERVEDHKGLFFTVQIAVHQYPVSNADLKNIPLLMVKRLENGWDRFSVGLFHTVKDAENHQREVRNFGFTEAIVIANYQSDRIPIIDAVRLIQEKGTQILEIWNWEKQKDRLSLAQQPMQIQREKQLLTTNKQERSISPKKIVGKEQLLAENKKQAIRETIQTSEPRVQLVTKQTFAYFPREILNRYNNTGCFYFDAIDGKVKSVVANSTEELPQIHYFKEDLDTLLLHESEEEIQTIFCVVFEQDSIPGDFMDWLLRYNHRKEFKLESDKQALFLFGILDHEVADMEQILRRFNVHYEFQKVQESNWMRG